MLVSQTSRTHSTASAQNQKYCLLPRQGWCTAGGAVPSGKVLLSIARCRANLPPTLLCRDNVLLGERYHAARYRLVLHAAALLPDLEAMPAGDLTMGEMAAGSWQLPNSFPAAGAHCTLATSEFLL